MTEQEIKNCLEILVKTRNELLTRISNIDAVIQLLSTEQLTSSDPVSYENKYFTARTALKLSRLGLSKLADVPVSAIRRLEAGGKAKLETIRKISAVLKVEDDNLI